MNDQILELLEKYFGYNKFRPGQREVIDSVLAGNDNFVLMPTGGGKSLCYQLPALAMSGMTLVVSPLIALMKDQVDALKADGISAEFMNSSLSSNELYRIQNDAMAGKIKLLYVAPERIFLDNFKILLNQMNLSLIAIDEAHCISEWGHDFRPEYRNLKMLKQFFPQTKIIALTATATEKVRQDILNQLGLQNAKVFISGFNRPNLFLRVEKKSGAFEKLLQLLKRYKDDSSIVYCFSRKETESVAENLRANGMNALPYHAGLDPEIRKQTQEKFIRDEINIIVATIAFGMGVDKPNVRLVAHYTFPKSLEGYYQEIGRAGRDGLPSECVLFFSRGDAHKHEYFINEITDLNLQNTARKKLRDVIEFMETNDCRRKRILNYFGDTYNEENCGNCDSCVAERETVDATEISRLIISGAIQLGGRFGGGHLVDVLRGSRNKKLLNLGHDRLPIFNLANTFSTDFLREVISELVVRGLLTKDAGMYPIISATSSGREFLTGTEAMLFSRKKTANFEKQDDEEYDRGLFEKLRALRKQIADSLGVPPFVIFGDKSLREMCWHFPTDRESFSRVSGVGQSKLEKFGDSFLQIISAYAAENDLTGRPFADAPIKIKRKSATEEITFELLNQKKSLEEMARERKMAISTIINHLDNLAKQGREISIDHIRPDETVCNQVFPAFNDCGVEYLKPAFDYLNGAVDYDTLRLARIFFRREQETRSTTHNMEHGTHST
ncbi:DNA helicase RecQ [Patescibacteria group bacterium]|nr:DNA helicase RecQ [Patescibacteria group bacterium]